MLEILPLKMYFLLKLSEFLHYFWPVGILFVFYLHVKKLLVICEGTNFLSNNTVRERSRCDKFMLV